jgi:hypothetical protein
VSDANKRRFTETPYNCHPERSGSEVEGSRRVTQRLIAGFLDFARNDTLQLLFQFPLQNFSNKLRIRFAFGQFDHLSFKKI